MKKRNSKKSLRKNIIREIKNTKSRFISILAIIALSTGFFTGVKTSSPSMMETGSRYFEEQNLMDLRLISTVGFDDDDIRAIKKQENTIDVMPSYMTDLIVSQNNIDSVARVHALPELTDTNEKLINEPIVIEGRLPDKGGECVIDSYFYESSGYKIGSTIKFNEKVQDNNTTDFIKYLEYKIVGVVEDPLYLTYQRGNTNVGNGSISFYIMIPPDDFVSERYTAVYVTTKASDKGLSPFSEEYKKTIESQIKEYEDLSKKRIKIFNDTTLTDAKKELSDAKIEYNDKKAEAEKEIADGAKELHNGEAELAEGLLKAEKEITDGEKELENGKKELAEGQKKYTDGIAEAKTKLTNAQNQYAAGKEAYTKAKLEYDTQISKAQAGLDSAQNEYDKQYSVFYSSTKPRAETMMTLIQTVMGIGGNGIEELETIIDELNEKYKTDVDTKQSLEYAITRLDEYRTEINGFLNLSNRLEENNLTRLSSALKNYIELVNNTLSKTEAVIKKISGIYDIEDGFIDKFTELKDEIKTYYNSLEEYSRQLDDASGQLADGEKQLADSGKQLADAKAQFENSKADGAKKLADAQIQLDNAQSQLDIGKLEYDNAMNSGMLELQAAQTEISQAEEKLKLGKQEIQTQKSEGMRKLKEAREKLALGKAEAHSGLSEGEKKINEAQDAIDALNDAKWYVYDRDENPGYSGLEEDALRVDYVAAVFPVFFLLVAALVCLTTMTRMVEERRTEIGTLKALGYTNISIAAKYFIYAALAAVSGSIVGAIAGLATLPYIIINTYSMMYILPETILKISWESFAFSAGTGILCTCIVAIVACYSELKLRPASLMRPKAPKPGKRIILEYIPFLWKHMNFTSKVTARNLFRYKARFLMTVIGVAGCTALILAGLGLKDSITVIADRQFGEISKFDQVYALSQSGTADEKAYLMSQFHNDKRFSDTLLVSQHSTTIKYGENKKISFNLIIGEDDKKFEKMFVLRDRLTHEKIDLNDDSVVINERLAEVIGAEAGDRISFSIDEVTYSSTVSGLTENYAGNYMYMTPNQYKKLSGKETEYNVVYTQVDESYKDAGKDIANDWMQNDDIVTVSLISEQVDSVLGTLDSLNVIVFVLIVCAGLLAVVVLYNLTNINISERAREIATIKVLGFYNMETANYIYRENMVLTVVGAIIGLPLGTLLSSFVVLAIQMDMVMFPQQVNLISYIIAFVLTLAFSLLVNFVMYFKMKKISMVESLKSIE